jgi:hypothetical protein
MLHEQPPLISNLLAREPTAPRRRCTELNSVLMRILRDLRVSTESQNCVRVLTFCFFIQDNACNPEQLPQPFVGLDLVAVVSVNPPPKTHVFGPVRAVMLIHCRMIYWLALIACRFSSISNCGWSACGKTCLADNADPRTGASFSTEYRASVSPSPPVELCSSSP